MSEACTNPLPQSNEWRVLVDRKRPRCYKKYIPGRSERGAKKKKKKLLNKGSLAPPTQCPLNRDVFKIIRCITLPVFRDTALLTVFSVITNFLLPQRPSFETYRVTRKCIFLQFWISPIIDPHKHMYTATRHTTALHQQNTCPVSPFDWLRDCKVLLLSSAGTKAGLFFDHEHVLRLSIGWRVSDGWRFCVLSTHLHNRQSSCLVSW